MNHYGRANVLLLKHISQETNVMKKDVYEHQVMNYDKYIRTISLQLNNLHVKYTAPLWNCACTFLLLSRWSLLFSSTMRYSFDLFVSYCVFLRWHLVYSTSCIHMICDTLTRAAILTARCGCFFDYSNHTITPSMKSDSLPHRLFRSSQTFYIN